MMNLMEPILSQIKKHQPNHVCPGWMWSRPGRAGWLAGWSPSWWCLPSSSSLGGSSTGLPVYFPQLDTHPLLFHCTSLPHCTCTQLCASSCNSLHPSLIITNRRIQGVPNCTPPHQCTSLHRAPLSTPEHPLQIPSGAAVTRATDKHSVRGYRDLRPAERGHLPVRPGLVPP